MRKKLKFEIFMEEGNQSITNFTIEHDLKTNSNIDEKIYYNIYSEIEEKLKDVINSKISELETIDPYFRDNIAYYALRLIQIDDKDISFFFQKEVSEMTNSELKILKDFHNIQDEDELIEIHDDFLSESSWYLDTL